MNEKEFYYLDRPAVPATQQSLIDPDVFLDQGAIVQLSDLSRHEEAYVLEVKDELGNVDGTILYIPGSSLEQLIGGDIEELTEAMEDEVEDSVVDDGV